MRKVFVSSTSEDLKPYRQAAKDVVLDLGWHPEMMEHFGTDGSVGIVEACKRRVGASDLVLAILGWRRGWVPGLEVGGDGRSMTQIEIETAKNLGRPIVTLLANDAWPGNLWESDPGARQQIETLRGGVDRLAVFFRSEPYEAGVSEPLPEFRAKVRQEFLRHLQTLTARRRELLARWLGRETGRADESRVAAALAALDGPEMRDLAGNPLYLTLMALLFEQGAEPVRRRKELYDRVFQLLLQGKHHPEGRPIEALHVVRLVLRRIAIGMTADNRDAEPRPEIERRLYDEGLRPERKALEEVPCWHGRMSEFLEDLGRTGILAAHDGEDADWRFWHRTFRE